MKLSAKRTFYIMIGVLVLLFALLITVTVLGNSLLSKQAASLHAVKLDVRLIEEQQSAVVRANRDIQKYTDLKSIADTIVPKDKDQARSVRQIVALADVDKIPISSITFPASTLGAAAAPAAATTQGTTSTASTPAATVAAPNITQAVPVQGMNGVYQTLITIQSSPSSPIPYSSLISFLKALENNRRTAHVDNITITPNAKNPQLLTFQLGVNVFTKP